MAKTITIADVLEDVRAQFEIRSAALSDVILTRWANKALALLWDHLISVNPSLIAKSATVSVTSGTDSYDLSSLIADFYKGQGITVLDESSRPFPLATFVWENRYLYADTVSSRRDQLYCYRDKYLYLAPVPAWSGTLTVGYCPIAPTLFAGVTPSAPTTLSTQASGATGATVVRVNLAAATVYVNGQRSDAPASADAVLHSGTVYTSNVDSSTLTSGTSAVITLVYRSTSAVAGQGSIGAVLVKGPTSAGVSPTPATDAQIQAVVGAGLPWVEGCKVYVRRTGDTAISQTQYASPNCVDLFNSWDEFMVAHTAWRAAIKEGDPTVRELEKLRNQLLAEIKSFAVQRELNHNDMVRDIRQRGLASNPFARLPDPT